MSQSREASPDDPPASARPGGARRRLTGCGIAAGLVLLAILTACGLSFVGVWRTTQIQPPYPPAQSVSLGPVTVLSGLMASGPCATYGLTADKWRCAVPSHTPGTGFPTSYRLWMIVTSPGDRLYTYQILRFALPPSKP